MTTMLYKFPGPHFLHGDKFDYIIVEDSDVEATLKDGWFLTTTEAKEQISNQPPSREELEMKATELKLKFDGRTTDKKLSQLIEESLKG